MKKGFLAILSLFLLHNLFAQETTEKPFRKFASFNEALQQAKKENKLLFVDIYFTGCRPCAQMDREVYPNEVVLPVLEKNFISTKYNVSNEIAGDTLCLRYMVSGFPALLILDGDGRLVSQEGGFLDAGMFLDLLNKSLNNAKNNKFLSGFSTTYVDDYPAFYKKSFFAKGEDRKLDFEEGMKYIRSQKDWLKEKPALALFLCRFKLDNNMGDYLLKNYNQYVAMYGEEIVIPAAQEVLKSRLLSNKVENNAGYEKFLTAYKGYFPEQDWKACLQALNMDYYLRTAKDTAAYFKAMSQNPVLYKNYFSVVTGFSSPKYKTEYGPYLTAWADAVVDIESSIQIIHIAATAYKFMGDMNGYKKYMQLALDKMDKYKIEQKLLDKAYFEKALSELNES